MGFSFATHYCHGKAVKTDIVLGNNTLDCGMNKMNASCDNKGGETELKKRGCCENESFSLDTDDDYQSSPQIDVNANFFIPFVHAFIVKLAPQAEVQKTFRDYSPPPVRRNIQVLYQTFLI